MLIIFNQEKVSFLSEYTLDFMLQRIAKTATYASWVDGSFIRIIWEETDLNADRT